MALQLSEVIRAARDRHPGFIRENVPDAALARWLTGYQRELVSRALAVNRAFLTAQMSVAFDLQSANAVGVAGAGTSGGTPADVTNGSITAVQAPLGTAAEIDVGPDAAVFVSESPVTSATATTLVDSTKAWTVNAHTSRTVVIRAGTGQGQLRTVDSNTATQLTVSQAWDTVPDTTSLYEVVVPEIEATQTMGVVTASPFTRARTGYVVRLTAGGVPYLDVSAPVVASYAVGIELPPHHFLLGGTVRFTDEQDAELTLVDYGSRTNPRADFAAYVENAALFLCGNGHDWRGATSVDLRFVPIPPALTRLTDYFLVPDSAYQALVDGAAWHAALRVNGLEGVAKLDPSAFWEAKQSSEGVWVREVSLQKRRAAAYIKPWGG